MSRSLRWFLSAIIGSMFAVQVQAQDPQLEDPAPAEAPMTVEETEAADASTDLVEGALDVLTPEHLQAVLLHHVHGEGVDGESIEMGASLLTVGGRTLQLAAADDGMTVNDALVSKRVDASNGQIYILDTVLMPPPGEDDSPGDGSDSESEPDDGP